MTSNPHENPKDAILEQIRTGALTMRPKFHFFLKALLVAVVALVVLALSIFLASFIVFGIRLNGSDALLSFGSRGFFLFLQVFPWPLVLVDIGLLILLEALLRRFRFAYSRSILYLFLIIIVVVGSSSIVIERGGHFHEGLFEHSRREGLPPPFQKFYQGAPLPPPRELGIYRGVVVSFDGTTLVLTNDDFDNDEDDGIWTVLVPEAFDETTIQIGDRFFVAGDEDENEIIRAYGLKELEIRGKHR